MVMAAEQYLKDTVDRHIVIKPWSEKDKLPLFLRNSYTFYEMVILGHPCVLLEVSDEPQGIVAIGKHMRRVQAFTDRALVLCFKDMTRYRRTTLIESRIPFVIADGQAYLPFLGLDLKQTAEAGRKEVTAFSAATQQAYLQFLYDRDMMVNATEFAGKLGVTKMTASRALVDLYEAKLLTFEIGGQTGRSKIYQRIQDPDYFEKGKAFFRTPVREMVYTRNIPDGALTAGLEVLAGISMLNPPEHPVRAISYKELEKTKLEIVRNRDIIRDEKLTELQIWRYDPLPFAHNGHVDLFSLYASLQEEDDERVVQALKMVLRGEEWYTD